MDRGWLIGGIVVAVILLTGATIATVLALTKQQGLTYSRFIDGLARAGVEIDRKVLAELAISQPDTFRAVVEKAKGARLAPA